MPTLTHTLINVTVEAFDKETFDNVSMVWQLAELQLWMGRGYPRRPHRIRNPTGSEIRNPPGILNQRPHRNQR
eukprot:7385313-Pyramimonas_sp.AAC.2